MQGVMAVYNRARLRSGAHRGHAALAEVLDRILGQSAEVNEAQDTTHELPSGQGAAAGGLQVG